MNVKRFIGAALVAFVFMFFYDWIVHGVLLRGLYHQTPQVWRGFADMASKIPLGIFFQLILSVWLAFVFTQLFKAGGVGRGLIFGLFFGVFAGILAASWYLWVPVAAALAWIWFASALVQSLIIGAIIGAIYRK